MIELSKEEMYKLNPLCKEINDVVLWSCVEGNLGRAWVDRKDYPVCAIVVAGDFCYLLGCLGENVEEIILKELLKNCRGKVIVTDDVIWLSIIKREYPNSFKKFSRYAIKKEPNIFQRNRLNDFIKSVEPEYQVKGIDESIYYKALEDGSTADFCCFFSSFEDYLKHGIGYFILYNGEIISGASSYTYCRGNIEITIGTKMEYRKKGLALACASGLILDCMDKNIYPRWDAANLESVALAEKLGYHFEKEYTVYSI